MDQVEVHHRVQDISGSRLEIYSHYDGADLRDEEDIVAGEDKQDIDGTDGVDDDHHVDDHPDDIHRFLLFFVSSYSHCYSRGMMKPRYDCQYFLYDAHDEDSSKWDSITSLKDCIVVSIKYTCYSNLRTTYHTCFLLFRGKYDSSFNAVSKRSTNSLVSKAIVG